MNTDNRRNMKAFTWMVAIVYAGTILGASTAAWWVAGLPFFWTVAVCLLLFSPGIVITMLTGLAIYRPWKK